jgi:hypothetical protein
VQGQIDVGVNGPGTVRETRLTTNPPGNLGFNVADAGAMP